MKAGHILLATAVGVGVFTGGCAAIGLWKTTKPETASSPAKESPPTEPSPKEAAPKEATREEPIPLRRQDPKVIAYMTSVRRAIDLQWVYPIAALRQRVEGKLTLELTILENGQLGETRIVRSSGITMLDEEAIRAVKAAAPFKPIPAGIGRARITIVTTFDYSDNRPK
jgi:protein TonB